jgi:1-acyl-sn-glycerol-3-phosphate acyltransferase
MGPRRRSGGDRRRIGGNLRAANAADRARALGAMIAGALAVIARIISGASVRWSVPLAPGPQRVFFANHTSHLDFMVIWSALPPALRRSTRPVAGGDYWAAGAIRRYLSSRVFNAILIDRASESSSVTRAARSIQCISEGMGENCSIIVFPEGTRTLTGETGAFKSGLYHLCTMKPDLELIPVHLANMNRILPKGEFLPVPLLGQVTFGAPMRFDPTEDKRAFLDRARQAVLSLGEI